MRHAAVIDLQALHPFHADGRCTGLAIEPAPDTARLLQKHHCVLRKGPGQAVVVSPLDAGGQPLLARRPSKSLIFELRPTNEDFALFTDLSDLHGAPSPLFTNAHMPEAATGELELTFGTAGAPARKARGVLAEVEIVLHPGSTRRPLPALFHVTFRPRRWHWAYYCVTDLAPGDGELAIVDASPEGATPALLFGDEGRTSLDEHPDPSDRVGAQLVARHPGMHIVRFVSDQAVACREEPREHLELRLAGDRVSSPLPNPSLRSFSRRELPSRDPQDLLFQIIEHRARPFSNP